MTWKICRKLDQRSQVLELASCLLRTCVPIYKWRRLHSLFPDNVGKASINSGWHDTDLTPAPWEGEAERLQVPSQPRLGTEWDLGSKTKQTAAATKVSDCFRLSAYERCQSTPGERASPPHSCKHDGSNALEDFLSSYYRNLFLSIFSPCIAPRAKPVKQKVQLPRQAHSWHFLPTHSLGQAQELRRTAQGEGQVSEAGSYNFCSPSGHQYLQGEGKGCGASVIYTAVNPRRESSRPTEVQKITYTAVYASCGRQHTGVW